MLINALLDDLCKAMLETKILTCFFLFFFEKQEKKSIGFTEVQPKLFHLKKKKEN